ncbi:hypothetical protein SHKM778_47270 [Streptomyces sp. KM77-8]|uniref:Uncharacterized protein n=1 Tax=Streptomyces haneummycinicus TaxID=3074435 RepID=A0AAT9HM01_9ACTN
MALLFTRTSELPTLLGLLKRRREAVLTMRNGIEAESRALREAGQIGPLDAAMFRRRVMQLDADLAWQDELDHTIAETVAAEHPAGEQNPAGTITGPTAEAAP